MSTTSSENTSGVERRGLAVTVAGPGPSDQPALQAPGCPAAAGRRAGLSRVERFEAGVLAVGLGVGGPATTVLGLSHHDLRGLAFPVAMVAVGAWMWRREGAQGVRAMLADPLVSRADLDAARSSSSGRDGAR